MIKIELDESEINELIEACRCCCKKWLDIMETIEASFGSNAAVKIFYDEHYKDAFFHASKLFNISYKIENSLNKE